MTSLPSRPVILLCILALFATVLSSTTELASARPRFLLGQSEPNIGLRRALRGLFDRWEKVDTVPDYSSETTQYGLGGTVKVDKTQVYTDKEYEADTGTTTNVKTKLTGSASGTKDVDLQLTYQSQGGEYQGAVVSNGKEASGGIHQKYSIEGTDGTLLTENSINGSSEDTSGKAGVNLVSTVKDCSSEDADANCVGALLALLGQRFTGSIHQTQEYTNPSNGISSSNINEATVSTIQPSAGQQEEFTASATGITTYDKSASGSVNAVGSTGVGLTASSTSNIAAGN